MTDWTSLVLPTIHEVMLSRALQLERSMVLLRRMSGLPEPLPIPERIVKPPKKSKAQKLREKQEACQHHFRPSRGRWKCSQCGKIVSAEYAEGYEDGKMHGYE